MVGEVNSLNSATIIVNGVLVAPFVSRHRSKNEKKKLIPSFNVLICI